ncbi:MAG TPA: hypothetical protein VGK52_12980 [Polyangia bacterium]
MTTRRFGRAALVAIVLVVGASLPTRARAYDFSIDLRTIGQGYQVRGFAPGGGNELLTRRRLTQVLNLSVFDIEPGRWHADDEDRTARNVVYVDASLRFDSDFGGYMTGRPQGADEIRELQQSQVDVLYAFIGGRRMGGRVDFQLGRQLHFDLVDFYAFDGGDALVRLNRLVAAEAFGGTEVRGELPLASPMYELDGTSAGSRDPATRPAQNAALRPLAGAAVVLGGDGDGPVTARLAYRRMWSATADRLPGEPDTGVDDEKVALTASAAWARRVFLTAGVRYNLLLATFDDQQAALRVRAGARHWLGLEMAYLAPSFDGDSIWNVFASGAYRDLRGSYELQICEGLKLYTRGFARHYDAVSGEPEDGARWAGGGSAGAAWRQTHGVVRLDAYFDGGFGGRKTGADLSARWEVRPRAVELEGRLTGYEWRSDQQTATDRGFVLGAQAGGRYRLGQGVRLHLLVEDNVGTFYASQYRGLAVVELDASL